MKMGSAAVDEEASPRGERKNAELAEEKNAAMGNAKAQLWAQLVEANSAVGRSAFFGVYDGRMRQAMTYTCTSNKTHSRCEAQAGA